VFKTALILHQAGLAKAVTLARQSNNKVALDNISRSNINLSVYDHLRERYHQEGIATYTEIILGMPGETKESFKQAISEIADSPTQLFVYHCTVLPNTEMADPSYIARHGIKTVRVPLTEIHGEIRKEEMVEEYEDIIIETATMSQEDWIECAVFAWSNQLTNSFGVEHIPDTAIERFYQIARGITKGHSRAQTDERFGNIYWEPEEMAYLHICYDKGITGDMKEFAKKNVLWGRKSRVHVKKELKQ
jgi:putative methyltransferase